MYDFPNQSAFAERLPVAFAEGYENDASEQSMSAVGLILTAFICLTGGALLASLGGFGILMSLLIGWASSFVGLLAVIAALMLNDIRTARTRQDAARVANAELEMEKLRARWNQNLAMAQMAQTARHGATRRHRF